MNSHGGARVPPTARLAPVFFGGGFLSVLFIICSCLTSGAQTSNGELAQPQVNTDARPLTSVPHARTIVTRVHVVLDDGGPPIGKLEVHGSQCAGGSINSRGVATLFSDLDTDVCSVFVASVGYQALRLGASAAHSHYTAVMRRIGADELGSVSPPISVKMLRIPPSAHKAYAEGEVAMGLGRWPEAVAWFSKAVAEYPAYALAWDEMGTALDELHMTAAAKAEWRKALNADPSLSRPCVHLAAMALREDRNEEAARWSDCAVRSPESASLLAWHYDAVANLRLGRFARAESSARQAIRIDDQHLLPRAQYVLGAALAERHDLNGAAEHLQRYLTLEPDGEFAAAARTGLDEIRKTATRP